MNVYEADIWCGVKHNGVFSHNSSRPQLIHALNEEGARKKIKLSEARTVSSKPNLIEVSVESIYSIRKTGTVTKQMYYVYSDGRNPRPVKVS